MSSFENYSKICFVIMPFGVKEIIIPMSKNIFGVTITRNKKVKVDFDYIYDKIFMPAISSIILPEGGKLIPKRADKEFYSGSISETMFEFIQYSRMSLADISGLNANVFYELGARHSSNSSGTAIFRLSDSSIPFDIKDLRAFPYKYNPFTEIEKSKKLVKEILENSLKSNVIDSPIYLFLHRQKDNSSIKSLLLEAENYLRNNDNNNIIKTYDKILAKDDNPIIRMKKGLIYKNKGMWENALLEFNKVTKVLVNYSDGYREKGIAENKLYETDKVKYSEDGSKSLEKAISLNNQDYDSYCSLGGVLKRSGNLEKAVEMYNKAIKLSLGNPYPLLNAIKIQCNIDKKFNIDENLNKMINESREYLENQIVGEVPYNAPWSFFDLSEIYSVLGEDKNKIIDIIKKGVDYSTHWWQIETFKNSLMLLDGIKNLPEGYKDSIKYVDDVLKRKSGDK